MTFWDGLHISLWHTEAQVCQLSDPSALRGVIDWKGGYLGTTSLEFPDVMFMSGDLSEQGCVYVCVCMHIRN